MTIVTLSNDSRTHRNYFEIFLYLDHAYEKNASF